MALSHSDNVTLLRVEKDAGHGAGMPLEKYIHGYAETFAFIEKAIGPVNQDALKASIEAGKQAKKDAKAARRARPFKEKMKDVGKFLKKFDLRNIGP